MSDSDLKKPGRQSGQYDKIFRENLEVTLPIIIQEVLGIDVASSEELPDDIQHTKERKPDGLKKITTSSGETFVLHIEFQLVNDYEMIYRMLEYRAMLMRRYKLPVKQYVIFLGEERPQMATSINDDCLKYSYPLLMISEMNYRLFLNSVNPEVKMLALLADLKNKDPYSIVKEVVTGIQEHTKGDLTESRYFNQLRIFVKLRSSIQPQFEKVMQSVSLFFKEEEDFLYKKGAEKERAKAEAKMHEEKRNIARQLKKIDVSVEDIAKATGLSKEEIEGL
ncbi:hypothetical protein [Desertivirga xinjiangensis]|uniref:hypothetical protein n=1 Tax=Desertivirga xinjiangensis TaxID=539206 RepID=UPI00210D0299|nr:hypothetical protein [Pedobacter xinjiangensis]